MKNKLISISSLLLRYLFYGLAQISKLLPVKNKRIVCNSYSGGRQYSDSPMYITEYLLDKYKGQYEIVWIFKDPSKFKFLEEKGIKTVKFGSLKDFIYSNTAKVYITNTFGPYFYVINRRNRLIIETTHGVAYKHLFTNVSGRGNLNTLEKKKISFRINRCTYCLSGSRITSDLVYRKELGYRGDIIEKGLPRNDVFFQEDGTAEIKNKVRKEYGINDETKIVLVMPTWRKDNSRKVIELNYRRIVNLLNNKDGNNWIVLLRLHSLSRINISDIIAQNAGCVIDSTDYPNPQELLLIADILITDYSSVVWDFALQRKPILLYMPDVLTYNEERGFNISPSEWLLYSSKDEKELYEIIEKNSLQDIAAASSEHLLKFGNFETGESTRYICRMINEYCKTGV